MTRNRFMVTVGLTILSLLLSVSSALAQYIAAQAFATKEVYHAKGVKAYIWTAVQPSGWNPGIASPLGVCTTNPPCTGSFFETGFAKGTVTGNVLQQYVAYTLPDGQTANRFLDNLSDNTWYAFQSSYNTPLHRWQAFRYGVVKFTAPSLAFEDGFMVACGGEGGGPGIPMAVECNSTQYQSQAGTWSLYNYSGTQGNYCVYKPYDYGSVSWGPC